jgi:hypothetical protein
MIEEAVEDGVKVRTYLLELLDGTLVDTSALVDQVAYDDEYVRKERGYAWATHRWWWIFRCRRGR